jgi:AraC-like DNA-binding protein
MARGSLERSCGDWVRCGAAAAGVQLLQAWFAGAAYARHRHDTYAVGVTDSGVQCFGYRGGSHASTPGEVLVLHPDEPHDGYAGTGQGFGYRIVYVEPALVAEAARAAAGRACALPFVRRPVLRSRRLVRAIDGAFAAEPAPLAVDNIVLRLSEALMAEAGATQRAPRVDPAAVERARELLDGAIGRVVRSAELEAASGLSRFELARQFRAKLGTSPYRYSLMRRLDFVRARLGGERPTADLALEAGFADQPHFARLFKAAFGVTPGRYARLTHNGGAKPGKSGTSGVRFVRNCAPE